MPATVQPLPSLIRASAQDAANMAMRKAGRSKWSRADYNLAASTLERLVRACYGRPSDGPNSKRCFLRFQIAEQLQRRHEFGLDTDFADLMGWIDEQIGVTYVEKAA